MMAAFNAYIPKRLMLSKKMPRRPLIALSWPTHTLTDPVPYRQVWADKPPGGLFFTIQACGQNKIRTCERPPPRVTPDYKANIEIHYGPLAMRRTC